MRFNELCNKPEHPEKRRRPHCVASIFLMKDEWPQLKAICATHGATLLGVSPVPVIPALTVEILCPTTDAKFALYDEWDAFVEASPHRPRTDAEREAFNERYNPFPNIPRDWTC